MAKKDNYALLGDVPVRESKRGDLLKFSSYATVLARATIETKDSITIGVFGEWGTGKTSLMRLIQDEVDKEKAAAAVWFNAWQYEKEEHLIVPLTATINKELAQKKWSAKLADGAKSMRDALRAIAYGFSIKGKVGIPLISEAEVNLSPKDMIERYQDLTKDSVLARSLYFDAFERLAECAAGATAPRIVVFVDDLDRCFPPKAVELLEGIKLVLNLPGFSFVLGVYERIIQDFIKAKYAKDYNIDGSYFEDYLDKIVQIKVPVPAREPDDMADYIESLLKEGQVFRQESVPNVVSLIAEACKRNPRSIIRLLNRVMVTVRIGKLEGKDEYDPLALLLHIATDEPKYKRFRNALDVTVIPTAEEGEEQRTITIGELLAERLQEAGEVHGELIADLSSISVTGLESELKKAIETLDKNEHLCNLLKSKVGRRWLADAEFRHMLGQASESTLGEKEKSRPSKAEQAADIDEPIRQLQDNMVVIEGGQFDMGSTEEEEEQPIHRVTLQRFEMSAMPVTQAQYAAVMGHNPSHFKGEDLPVESVSWHDAREFCERLSQKTGRDYTLPSEAQWEYACRAGSTARYCFGDDESLLEDYAWYGKNSERTTHPVGKKKPNDWGLYDMHGNVWEWCLDRWDEDYKNAPDDGRVRESDEGSGRVFRGGSWLDPAEFCRCSYRLGHHPGIRIVILGFRVVLVPSS
ncbi:MAG: SUMF1/EgtB/PvdO family nonheme iron enzyme [Sedimentisphaerales bacterium]|nr:SUMF1/EgtB/PvdO family nonheme iron enzyme [Sedimentisphaerales bacterium]